MLLLTGEFANTLHINRQQLRSLAELRALNIKQNKKHCERLREELLTFLKHRHHYIPERWK